MPNPNVLSTRAARAAAVVAMSSLLTTVSAMASPLKAARCSNAQESHDVLHPYVGLIHAHTKYSDGDIQSIPADVYAQAREAGLDFAVSTDHSDTLNDFLFITTSKGCEDSVAAFLSCLIPNQGDLNRWRATGWQAFQATTQATAPEFSAIRGFEWTSDRFGHINVAFSSDFTNALLDQGYMHSMDNFWAWLARRPTQTAYSGGADGLAIFNHPDDKKFSDADPGRDWYHLAYEPSADEQMVGMELFNSGSRGTNPDSGRHPYYFAFYLLALSNGWHVGAVGSEDMHDTTWADPSHAKTVILAERNTPADLYRALRNRQMYAVEANTMDRAVRIEYSVQAPGLASDAVMGSRLTCGSDAHLVLKAHVTMANGQAFAGRVSLYDRYSQSNPLYTAMERLPVDPPLTTVNGADLSWNVERGNTSGADDWYVIRVDDANGQELGYTSPIWVGWSRP